MFLHHFNVSLELLHFGFHSFFPVFLWGCVSNDRQALVFVVQIFPVRFEPIQDVLSLLFRYLLHGTSSEVISDVCVVFFLCFSDFFFSPYDVFGCLAILLERQ